MNKLLQKTTNDFKAESNFINSRIDKYENILSQVKDTLTNLSKFTLHNNMKLNKNDDIIESLAIAYNIIAILQNTYNPIFNKLQSDIISFPEIKNMINNQ